MKTKTTLLNKPRVKESTNEFKRMIHNAVDGILVMDAVSKDILYWNKSMSRMLGCNGKGLYGLNIKDIHPHKELPGIMELFEKFCSNKICSVRNIPIKNKKGEISFADISGYAIDFCGRKCMVGFFRDAGERMKDKEALAKSERMYRALAEAVDDFVFIIDRNMRIEYVNTKGCKSFGLPIEKLVGKNLSALFPKDEAGKKKKSVAKVFREKRPASFESIANLPSGQEWLNTILAPIFDKNGKVVSVLGVARDLSLRKKMEDSLRAEKTFSDAIIDSIPGAFYLLDKNGRFLKWNMYEEEIFGMSSVEFKKRYPNALDTIIENDRPRVKKKLKEVIDKGSASVEAEVLAKGGARHFFMTGKRLYREGEPYIVGVALDMTEYKKASDHIAAHKKRYDLVVAATGQLVYDYNMKDGSIEWSGNIKSVTGYDSHDMEDNINTWSERIHPDDRDRAMRLLDLAAKDITPYDVEYRYMHKDGHYLWVHDRGFFITDDKGKAVRMLGIMHDVTDTKGLEEVKKQLIRAVSHELKTPIGMSKMALDMFRNALDNWDMARLKEARSILEKNMERLDKDAENILRLFALEATEKATIKRSCSLTGIVRDVIKQVKYMADYKRVKLKVNIDKRFDRVVMSKPELRAVIYNLIDNALKFTQKGHILIKASCRPGYRDVSVKDTGIGMHPEDRRKLFKRFFKGHPSMPGTGLGLVICQDIVKRYGGSIKADSEGPGKGSTITVSFPISIDCKGGNS